MIQSTDLTGLQSAQLNKLFHICQSYEPLTLHPHPQEDELFFLQYSEEKLICFLSVSMAGEEIQVYALTHPLFRKQGFFFRALSELEKKYPDSPLFFLTDGNSPDALACLKAIEAFKQSTEYLLSYRAILSDMEMTSSVQFLPETDSGLLAELHHRIFHLPQEISASYVRTISLEKGVTSYLIIGPECNIAGILFLLHGPNGCYLCSFGILPEYQKKGLGISTLIHLTQTPDFSALPLFVQVSDQNAAALTLYRKFGFMVETALTTYEW